MHNQQSQLCQNHWEHKIHVNFISYACPSGKGWALLVYTNASNCLKQNWCWWCDVVSSTHFIINYMMKIELVVCKSLCKCVYVYVSIQFSSVTQSYLTLCDPIRGVRPPCPSPTPRIHSDSWPSSQWCHPAISSSVIPFSCPQCLPASGSFPMSQLFTWGGQSIGVSASASVLPMNTQHRSHIYWMQINILIPWKYRVNNLNWKNKCNFDYTYLDTCTCQGRCSSGNLMKFNATKPTRHILKRMYRF